jgi:HSF-type DNA-binding
MQPSHSRARCCHSFTRQLYLWGFVRVSSGPDAGAFWHELFLDGHDQLLRYMRRVGAPQGVKEDRRKTIHRFGIDPDFYAMEPPLRCPSAVTGS